MMKKTLISCFLFSTLISPIFLTAQWQRQYPLTKLENVLDIAVHGDGHGYAVGADDMILKLDQATQTWSVVGDFNKDWILEAVDYLDGTGGQYAAAGGQGLITTDDHGNTWDEIAGAPGGIHAILYIQAQQILVSSDEGVFFWDNGTWTDLQLPVTFGVGGAFLLDRNHIWAFTNGAEPVIYYTSNGGLNWDSNDDIDRPDVIQFYNTQYGVATDARTIYHTYNGGDDWIEISNNEIHNSVNGMTFGTSPNILMAVTNNAPTITSDSGRTWVRQDLDLINDRSYSVASFSDQDFWVGSNVSSIALSENGGVTWEERCGPERSILYDLFFVDRNHGFSGGFGGALLRTSNAGQLWTEVDFDPTRTVWSIHGLTINDMWIGATRGIFHSSDMGMTWTEKGAFASGNYVDVLAISATRILGCSTAGIIIRSDDSGATWDTVYQTNAQIRSLARIDDQRYYATGFNGLLLKSNDQGATWNPVTAPEAGLQYEQTQFIGEEGWMITSSFESTMWHTPDAGNSWTPISLPIDRNWDGIYFITPDTGIVVCRSNLEGRTYITFNGGMNWQSGYITEFPIYGVSGLPNPNGTAWIHGFGSDIENLPYCNMLPVISDFVGDVFPCENDTVMYHISSQDVDQFFWLFPTGWQIIGNADNDTVFVKVGRNSGNISVTGTNACGFSSPINVGAGASLLPVISFITGDQSPCESEVKTYTVTSQEVDDYIWVFPDASWDVIGNDNTDAIQVLIGETSGTISVIGINQCGIDGPAELEVTPDLRPRTTGVDGPLTPCTGETVEYIASTQYADTVVWSFPFDWLIVDNADLNSIAVVVGSFAGTVTAQSFNDCGESAIQEINVNPVIVPQVFIGVIPEVDDLTAVTSAEVTSYQWYFNGLPIPGANAVVYVPLENGDYYVEVIYSTGCKAVSPVHTVTTVAVQSVIEDAGIQIVPSPASDYIIVMGLEKEMPVEILDSDGKSIIKENVFDQPISIERCAPGVYVMKLKMENGIVVKQFAVVR